MWLNTTQVQQMAGRAGRAGLDTQGEVVMLCPPRCKDLGPYADLLKVRLCAPASRLEALLPDSSSKLAFAA